MTAMGGTDQDTRRVGLRIGVGLAVVALVLIAAWRLGFFALEDRERLAAAIARVREVPYLVPAFIATYAVAAAAGVPATPLTLAGGALFGSVWGVVINWVGEMCAASLAFAGVRAMGLRATPRAADAQSLAVAATRSARTLFRLRLVPVAPFVLLNAGAALSGMGWREYLLATAAGIIPITVVYTVSAAQLVAGVAGSGTRAFATAAAAAALLIVVSFLPGLLRLARKRA